MPEIVRFYGIIIKMFFSDHPPPHIHAVYAEYNATFDIKKCTMIEGDFPKRAQNLVIEWMTVYQQDLTIMWQNEQTFKLPALK